MARHRQFKDALAGIEILRRASGDDLWCWALEAQVYGRAGECTKAQRAMQRFQQGVRSWQGDPTQLFDVAYAGINEKG